MRLFIALEVSEYISGRLRAVQDEIKVIDAKLTFPKQFHLTLKFLGDVDDDKIGMIKERLDSIKFKPFKLRISEIDVFPDKDHIKVIWAGVKNSSKVYQLHKQVDDFLKDMFEKDKRFHPHITLARVKFVRNKARLKKIIEETNIEEMDFEVKRINLISSSLTPQGPIYEII